MLAIESSHLTKWLGEKNRQRLILNNVSLKVAQGEFVGIMGPSGAGKSTLLKTLATLTPPTSGEVYLNGHRLNELKKSQIEGIRNQEIGFVFQDFNLVETLDVEKNLSLPLVLQGKKGSEVEIKIQQIAETFGLTSLLKSAPRELSIGQKQRVTTARAFIHQPKIVFADEPTGALDSKNAAQLLAYFEEMNQLQQTTILMVTHDPFAASFCQRILFFKDGQIFSEIIRRDTRESFFKKIIQMQGAMGGRLEDV